ncbi:MAG: hypothetical protein A2077_05050 [Nitrospirae bacterium GWC2_46_6]|nr:MAG: hypothetical protein A2Z82_12205 [Nitrospirae bacterium GWA2_46_11]OGW22640.1 MAG: hypothetical protein A2077_05050 [Nitrospirae bacterium GWC2_46_6]OGW23013.1 MAG: hypothetical protein A2X55_12635 [Nitrospirae bacterium GWB2_47_37]HAK88356.1 hypothetical protein [Nitrospiraceae bacterium]HCL81966.1 hypothetical protein [Nitrospiraceae bacterium]
MKCSKAHKLISPYSYGELSEKEWKAVENHLNVCHGCRTEFEEMRGLSYLLVNTEKFKAPYGFHTRVMANISSGKARVGAKIPVIAGLAEGFAIIAVIVLGIFSGTQLTKGFMPDRTREVTASLSLDVFDSAPSDSLGGAYLAMTEVRDEK